MGEGTKINGFAGTAQLLSPESGRFLGSDLTTRVD